MTLDETLLCVIYSIIKEKMYFCLEEYVNKMDIVTEISANELKLNPNQNQIETNRE